MHTTKTIQNFTQTELKKGIDISGSWHEDYKNSAYIFIGGITYEMNEGDIVIVFSQFGEIVDIHLIRDKKTGKSKGFAFLAYEDQRSTSLAVDNFNGAEICGRTIRVDHVKKFRPPKEYLEFKEEDNFMNNLYKPSGPDGKGWGKYRILSEEEKKAVEEYRKLEKTREKNKDKLIDEMQNLKNITFDEDERWEKMLLKNLHDEEKEGDEKKEKRKNKKNKKIKKNKKSKKDKKENKDKRKKDNKDSQEKNLIIIK